MKRAARAAVTLAVAATAALVAGVAASFVSWTRPPDPMPRVALASREAELSRRLDATGMTRRPETRVELDQRVTLDVPRDGRCFAFVLVAETVDPIVARVEADGRPRVVSTEDHLVGLASCHVDDAPSRLVVTFGEAFERRARAQRVTTGTLHVLTWAGDTDLDPLAPPVGEVPREARARLRGHELARRSNLEPRRDETTFLGPIDVRSTHALAIPASPTNLARLRVAAAVGTSRAPNRYQVAMHPRSPPPRNEARATPLHGLPTLPSWLERDERWRLVALVDPDDLPWGDDERVPCVDVQLFARTPLRLHVATTPTGVARPLDGFQERLCPGDGPRYYVVPPDDADGEVRVRVFRAEGDGPRVVAPPPDEVPPPVRLVWDEQGCDAGTAGACRSLARRHRFGTHGPVRVDAARRAYERGCELDPSVCVEAASFAPPAVPWLRRACAAGVARGCAMLGDRLRRAGEYAEAHESYAIACRSQDRTACWNQRAMEAFDLASR